jgi:hypothetical protein
MRDLIFNNILQRADVAHRWATFTAAVGRCHGFSPRILSSLWIGLWGHFRNKYIASVPTQDCW